MPASGELDLAWLCENDREGADPLDVISRMAEHFEFSRLNSEAASKQPGALLGLSVVSSNSSSSSVTSVVVAAFSLA
jgi:hypothetical protein